MELRSSRARTTSARSSITCWGPHGIPIEGEWYTGTFRDLVFGPISNRARSRSPVTYAAYDIAKAGDKPIENTTLPLRYAGVENQYFAALLEPVPLADRPGGPLGQPDGRAGRTASEDVAPEVGHRLPDHVAADHDRSRSAGRPHLSDVRGAEDGRRPAALRGPRGWPPIGRTSGFPFAPVPRPIGDHAHARLDVPADRRVAHCSAGRGGTTASRSSC